LALYGSATPTTANANPFLAKAGEASTTVQVATCAVSGGFIHLYTAMDNGLFDKYGIKIDHRFISGSAMNLAALSPMRFHFSIVPLTAQFPDWPAAWMVSSWLRRLLLGLRALSAQRN